MQVRDEGRSNAAHWHRLATERQQELDALRTEYERALLAATAYMVVVKDKPDCFSFTDEAGNQVRYMRTDNLGANT